MVTWTTATSQTPVPLCDIWQTYLNCKMRISSFIILITLLASCKPSTKKTTTHSDIPTKQTNPKDNNSITITDVDYVLYQNGIRDTFKTVAQLTKTLEKASNQIGKDTLYIYMKSTNNDRMVDVSPMLRKLNINKYQFVITEDFFALPYPKETK